MKMFLMIVARSTAESAPNLSSSLSWIPASLASDFRRRICSRVVQDECDDRIEAVRCQTCFLQEHAQDGAVIDSPQPRGRFPRSGLRAMAKDGLFVEWM